MSIPSQAVLDLTILHCTSLPPIDHELKPHSPSCWQNAEIAHRRALDSLQEALKYASSAPPEMYDEASNYVERCMNYERTTRAQLESAGSQVRFSRRRLPNPFVVVSLDEDHEGDRPLAFSKSIRETSRPLWRETFSNIPLGRYVQYVVNRERNEYNDRNYRPSRLVFSIYDDDAVPVQGVPHESDGVWKRYTPRRGTLLATAEVRIECLLRRTNSAEFELELPLRTHSRGSSRRNDQCLTVKMKLSDWTACNDYGHGNRHFCHVHYYH